MTRLYPRNTLDSDRRTFGLILQLSTLRQITKASNREESKNCEKKVVKFVYNGFSQERTTEGRQRLCPVLRASGNQSLHFVTSACTRNRRLTRSIRITQQQLMLLVDKAGLSLRLSEGVLMSVGAVGLGQRNRRTAILIPGEREIEARVRKMVSSRFQLCQHSEQAQSLSLSLSLCIPGIGGHVLTRRRKKKKKKSSVCKSSQSPHSTRQYCPPTWRSRPRACPRCTKSRTCPCGLCRRRCTAAGWST
jgi:hypothetical protein